jgi:tripartite-type tricarboxylate transporter receptor subunit TctC
MGTWVLINGTWYKLAAELAGRRLAVIVAIGNTAALAAKRTQNTPPEIIDKLNKEVNAALADPKLKLRLGDLGSSVAGGSAADYGRRLEKEAEKWGKVIRTANIKAE